MGRRHGWLGLTVVGIGVAAIACGGSSDGSVSGGQDVVARPGGSASGSATPGAGTAPAPSATTAPAAAAPKILLSCTDKSDATATAFLSVDASDGFVWQISGDKVTTTLVSVDKDANSPGYDLHVASGHFLHLALQLDGNNLDLSMGGLDVECDAAAAHVDTATLDALVQATAASRAKQQPFATCRTDPSAGDGAGQYTVRPALTGAGAIIEGNTEEDENEIVFATSLSSDVNGTVYKGDGGLTIFAAGQHVSHLSTMTTSGAADAVTMKWNVDQGVGADGPVQSTSCTVKGDAFAKSLIAPPGK